MSSAKVASILSRPQCANECPCIMMVSWCERAFHIIHTGLTRTICWTYSLVASDLWSHDALVMSLLWILSFHFHSVPNGCILLVIFTEILLTHWGRVTHLCVGKLTIIGSDNGLSPGRRQAIIWTNDGMLLIWALGTNFSEILSEIQTFSFWKNRLKVSSAKWRPFCLGLNELKMYNGPSKCSSEIEHIGAGTKWQVFCRQDFQMHFSWMKII